MGQRRNWGQSVVRVSIYIEGGGTSNSLGRTFRSAWGDFFASAGFAGKQPAIKRGGGRRQTFDSFVEAARKAGPDELPILLVDSEGPVPDGQSTWQYLQDKDSWRQPAGTDEDSAYLMVQAMEAWLLADREAVRDYFGQGFNESRLPRLTDPELIAKGDLESSLRAASAGCRRQYDKGAVSFEILGRVNAAAVASRCRHAKALFDYLRSL